MQKQTLQNILQRQDPFQILRDYRKKNIRPKAKYVRKTPFIPRKTKTTIIQNIPELFEHKNQRKMTADSELQMELLEDQGFNRKQDFLQGKSVNSFELIDSFFSNEKDLQFIMPLEYNQIFKQRNEERGLQNYKYMDFFIDQ